MVVPTKNPISSASSIRCFSVGIRWALRSLLNSKLILLFVAVTSLILSYSLLEIDKRQFQALPQPSSKYQPTSRRQSISTKPDKGRAWKAAVNQDQTKSTGWKSTLPAANFAATESTSLEVCFLTSVYASSSKTADHPPSVQVLKDQNPTFRFFAFSNLPDLKAPGWAIIKKELKYKRYITQSRWAKFMAWQDPQVYKVRCFTSSICSILDVLNFHSTTPPFGSVQCQAVIYMDGFCSPKEKHSDLYKRLARAIFESEYGLFQNKHDLAKGPLDELDRILAKKKDIEKNVAASKTWLLAQPDFRPNSTMYVNTFLGYNPKNSHFQNASRFFWDHYSLEEDSWRDQPLWAYTLDRYGIVPTRLGTFEALFRQHFKRMARGAHRYNKKTDSNAKTS